MQKIQPKTRVQSATGSKILTEPEPDRIGVILAGTGPDYKPENLTGFDWIGRMKFKLILIIERFILIVYIKLLFYF